MKSEDEFPKFLLQFIIACQEVFKGMNVSEIQVLRSDNASEFNSAEVQEVYRNYGIKRHLSCPGQQFQNGKAAKCIGDVWL
jgi:transposase InsO family protein